MNNSAEKPFKRSIFGSYELSQLNFIKKYTFCNYVLKVDAANMLGLNYRWRNYETNSYNTSVYVEERKLLTFKTLVNSLLPNTNRLLTYLQNNRRLKLNNSVRVQSLTHLQIWLPSQQTATRLTHSKRTASICGERI